MTRGALVLIPFAHLAALPNGQPPPNRVDNYRAFFAQCQGPAGRGPLAVLRSFRQDGLKRVLAVDPESLTTQVLPEEGLHFHRLSWASLRKATADTPYGRALADSERNAWAMQDAGLTHTLPRGKGVILTIDLCPSGRPLDRDLFRAILANFEAEERPVPLGIAITGLWMLEHPIDLAWLRQLERDRDVSVTWINHSFNHRYTPGQPLASNFLLKRGTDLNSEVLKTEAAMIANGLQPYVFFRFPGLISDSALVRRVVSCGLIPLGSDAWLAKGQQPSSGSIVLVHGNGNEPIGVKKFLELVRLEGPAIRERHWLLFDLRESVSREEERP